MHMFIVRHGETEWNRLGKVQGKEDIPLNEHGIEQAKDTARVFKGRTFEVVITSPLQRTKQTAAYLCKDAIVKSQREDERIIEKGFGVCEGMEIAIRHEKYPDGHAEGEESFQAVRQRMVEAVREYAKTYTGDVLFVTHGCAIAALLKELDPIFETRFIRLNNTSITIVNENLEVCGVDLSLQDAKYWLDANK